MGRRAGKRADPRIRREPAQRRAPPAAQQRVPLAHHGDEAVDVQHLFFEIARQRVATQRADHEVDVGVAQQAGQRLVGAVLHADVQLGVHDEHPRSRVGNQHVGGHRQRADRDQELALAAPACKLFIADANLGERDLHMLQQPLARFVQPCAQARALVQRRLRGVLEPPQRLMQRRLRKPHRGGSRRLAGVRATRNQRLQQGITHEARQRSHRGRCTPRPQAVGSRLQGLEGTRHAQCEGLARSGRHHAAGAALEQHHTERLLCALHGPRDRGR